MSNENDVKIGTVANCERLNVRMEPDVSSDVVCEIQKACEVMIDENESTGTFYKVYTSAGLEGFCMKDFIEV